LLKQIDELLAALQTENIELLDEGAEEEMNNDEQDAEDDHANNNDTMNE
jgi:hypothetical protein